MSRSKSLNPSVGGFFVLATFETCAAFGVEALPWRIRSLKPILRTAERSKKPKCHPLWQFVMKKGVSQKKIGP